MQTYDADKFLREIQVHLQLQGIDAEIQPDQRKDAHGAACQLLTTLGITPTMDGVSALIRASDKIWSEAD
jgi:hypothetical protein